MSTKAQPMTKRFFDVRLTHIISVILFLSGFYYSIQDQSLFASSMVVLSSILILLVGNTGQFSPLLSIPAFASIQLLFAFSLLDSSDNYSVTYGPLRFSQYIDIAAPLIFGYLVPFYCFRVFDKTHAKRARIEQWKIEAVCLDAVKCGLVSELASNLIGGLPVVGALIWYSSLLWKLAIPVLFFHTSRKKLAIGLVFLLLLMAIRSALYWNFILVMAMGVLYGYSTGVIKLSRVILLVTIGVFGSLVIQTFKHVQRTQVEFSTIQELRTIIESFENEAQRYVLFESLMGRLHQGLHDSFVYERCSSADCSDPTILKSAVGTFLPRILYPDKPSFNSDKLKNLGGYYGMGNSFITISGCAEAFANFGRSGGAVFMALFSFFILLFYSSLARMLAGMPALFLFIPFYHVIRVEVDFYHWFTCLIYGTIILKLFYSRWDRAYQLK